MVTALKNFPPARRGDETDADGAEQAEHQRVFGEPRRAKRQFFERVGQQAYAQREFDQCDARARGNENEQA